jgi:hypothetical protein
MEDCICDCICHNPGVVILHCVACCYQCPKCKRNVKDSRQEKHDKHCELVSKETV